MINSPRKIFYLILAIDLVLLVVGGFFIWQITVEKAKLAEIATRAPVIKASTEGLLAGSWSKLEAQTTVLDRHFLSASTTVEFLERLESTAKLTKTNLKINQAEAKDNLHLNFSIQGSFSAVNQFLTLLEKLPYALRLERLDLRAENQNSWRGDFIITIMAQI